jgi:hypothetical protein
VGVFGSPTPEPAPSVSGITDPGRLEISTTSDAASVGRYVSRPEDIYTRLVTKQVNIGDINVVSRGENSGCFTVQETGLNYN